MKINVDANEDIIQKYYDVYTYFKSIINQLEIINSNIIRYSFKKDCVINYVERKWDIDAIKIKNAVKTNVTEEEEFEINISKVFSDQLIKMITSYHESIYELKTISNINLNIFKPSTHLNYYLENSSFKIPHYTYYSRMPYHSDSSTYTIIQQNTKGIHLKNNPRILNDVSKLLIFDSNLKHRVELYDKERFSISTFLFE